MRGFRNSLFEKQKGEDEKMKCKNCNREVEDNIKFCPYCGTNLVEVPSGVDNTQNQEQNENQPVYGYEQNQGQNVEQSVYGYEQNQGQNVEQPVYGYEQNQGQNVEQPVYGYEQNQQQNAEQSVPYWERKPEKKNKRKFVIPGVILALVLVVGCVAFAMKDTLKNVYQKQFASDLEYYRYVEEENRDKSVEKICDKYVQYLNQNESGGTKQFSIKVEFSDALKSTIAETGIDVSKWDSATFNMSTAFNKTIYDMVYALQINDTDLLQIKVYSDLANAQMYMQIPEFSEAYLDSSYIYDSYTEEDKEALISMEEYKDWLPDEKALKKSFDTYSNIIFEGMDNAEKSSATLTAGGISQECTKISVSCDGEGLKAVVKKLMETAKEDEAINQLLEKVDEVGGTSTSVADYEESIEEGLKELEEMKPEDIEGSIAMDVYVDGEGDIIGRVITVESKEENITFSFCKAVANGKIGLEYKTTVDGFDTLCFEGSGDLKKDAVTGDFTFTMAEEGENSITVDVSAKDYKATEDGEVSGTLTFSTDQLPGASLDVTLAQEKTEKTAKIGISYAGVQWGTVTLMFTTGQDMESVKPSEDATIYDIKDEEQMQTYYTEMIGNIDVLVQRLTELTGIDEDTWSSIMNMTDSIGADDYSDDYNYSDDYDYDYSDDYNYEDYDYEDYDYEDYDYDDYEF